MHAHVFYLKIPSLYVFSFYISLFTQESTPCCRRAFVILYDFCFLFDYLQLIFPGSQADLFCLIQGCLPLNIRIGILKVVMMTVPSRLCQMLSKLAVGDRCCLQAGICTSLIQCNRVKACEHSDIRKDRRIIFTMAVTVRADILYQCNMEMGTSVTDSLCISQDIAPKMGNSLHDSCRCDRPVKVVCRCPLSK